MTGGVTEEVEEITVEREEIEKDNNN